MVGITILIVLVSGSGPVGTVCNDGVGLSLSGLGGGHGRHRARSIIRAGPIRRVRGPMIRRAIIRSIPRRIIRRAIIRSIPRRPMSRLPGRRPTGGISSGVLSDLGAGLDRERRGLSGRSDRLGCLAGGVVPGLGGRGTGLGNLGVRLASTLRGDAEGCFSRLSVGTSLDGRVKGLNTRNTIGGMETSGLRTRVGSVGRRLRTGVSRCGRGLSSVGVSRLGGRGDSLSDRLDSIGSRLSGTGGRGVRLSDRIGALESRVVRVKGCGSRISDGGGGSVSKCGRRVSSLAARLGLGRDDCSGLSGRSNGAVTSLGGRITGLRRTLRGRSGGKLFDEFG